MIVEQTRKALTTSTILKEGEQCLRELAERDDINWLDALSGYKENQHLIEEEVQNVSEKTARFHFIAILSKEKKIISERNYSAPLLPLHVADSDNVTVKAEWLPADKYISVIFSSDVLWNRIANIRISVFSEIPNPFKEFLFYIFIASAPLFIISFIRIADLILFFFLRIKTGFEKIWVKFYKYFKFFLAKKKDRPKKNTEKTTAPFSSGRKKEKEGDDVKMIGPYIQLRELGRGGMATVFETIHENNIPQKIKGKSHEYIRKELSDRNYNHLKRAVKIPRVDLSIKEQEIVDALFEREAELAEKLKHENIIYVYEVIKKNEKKALILEYVDGWNFFQFIHQLKNKPNALSEEHLMFIASEICKGLDCSHFKKIIHRDLTPGNILLSVKGDIKISDFGIAKKVESFSIGTKETVIGSKIKGTTFFMAPEQLAGKTVDQRSDIYSLGLLLYMTVSGITIDRIDPIEFGRKNTPIKPLKEIKSDISAEMNDIIMKCVQKNKDARFQTVREMSERLVDFKFTAGIYPDKHNFSKFVRSLFK